jgi:rod shape-determining protein MreB
VPRKVTINSTEIGDAIAEPISHIIAVIRTALQNTPPELAADISSRGVVLTGGGALIKALDLRVHHETGLPVQVSEDPLTCVARGSGAALKYIDNLNSVFMDDSV